jgi:RND family efflux transporter MFP subunit
MKTTKLVRLLPLFALCLLISCAGKKEETTNETEKVKVNVTTANLYELERTSVYTANVRADVINQITSAIGGRIEKIYVEVGSSVSKGQLLVQMDTSTIAQQNLQLVNLQRDYERLQELQKVGGIAQQQVDQIKTQIDVLTTNIKNVEDNTRLRSPINGIITNRNFDNGDLAGGPILTVQQLNPLKAVVYVSESYFKDVQKGMPVNLQLDVYGNEIFTGKVSLIYPTIDASTHTFGVEVAINNSGMRIRPGMFARVTLNFGAEQTVVVPDAAVQKQVGSNDRFVFVIEDGIARYRKVELGTREGEIIEILSGVNAGDVVVTAGQNRLIEGTAVEIVNN